MRAAYPQNNYDAGEGTAWWSTVYYVASADGYIEPSDIDKSPELNITREELAYIAYKLFWVYMPNYTSDSSLHPDYNDVDKRYRAAVDSLCASSVLLGDENHNLNPKDNLTRAEACAVLNRALDYKEDGWTS